jgi:hypothetical protein
MVGGPVGAFIFNRVMAKGATTRADKLLELNPKWNMFGWLILVAIGLISAAALWQFNRWIARPPFPREAVTRRPATVSLVGGFSIALAAWSLVAAGLALSSIFTGNGAVTPIVIAAGLIGWTVLQASVGFQMLRRKSWARGVFIVAFPTLWALTSTWFSAEALIASAAAWMLGLALLTRRSAMAFFAED